MSKIIDNCTIEQKKIVIRLLTTGNKSCIIYILIFAAVAE